jgi:hypothetical protein
MKLILITLMALPLLGQDPKGFVHWTAAELKGYNKKLAPKVDAKKVATADLAKFEGYWTMVAHREGPGEAELHDSEIDIFFPQTGEATLVVGGEVVDGKTTAPGQVRGTAIKGGRKMKLVPGDIAHIPAKTPHQVLLDPGKKFTYVIVKIEAK